jgi:hypothetical protein
MRFSTQRQLNRLIEAALASGSLVPGTLTRLNELLVADHEHYRNAVDFEEESPGTPSRHRLLFFDVFLQFLAISFNLKKEDQLHELTEGGVVDQLLTLPFVAEHLPELATPWVLADALKIVHEYQRNLYRNLDFWNDGELYHFALADFIKSLEGAVKRRRKAFYERAKQRCGRYKEELIAAAWAPRRVEAWLAAGMEVDAL